MTTIRTRLQALRARVRAAAAAAGRDPESVLVIAVSKSFPAEAVAEARDAGQCAFGENYVQEALSKIEALARGAPAAQRAAASPSARHVASPPDAKQESAGDVRHSAGVASPQAGPLLRPLEWHAASPSEGEQELAGDVRHSAGVASPQAGPLLRPLEWHFIGPIQSNKTKAIAEHFDWVHSVDREKIARRLSEARPPDLPPLNVCIQVNISGEATKSGVAPEEALSLARAIAQLPRLRLRGLMCVPEPTDDDALQHARFRALRELRDRIANAGIPLDTLSMGMTDDLEAAIAEGATIVRVGRAIFGSRGATAQR